MLPHLARETAVVGALTAVYGQVETALDADLFRIRIDDPAAFSARAITTNSPAIDPQLFLFDELGRGVVANDNWPGTTLPQIPPNTLGGQSFGIYLLGVSSASTNPLGPFNSPIFPSVDSGLSRPQGIAQFFPLTDWSRDITAAPGNYAIELTGASGESALSPGDFNRDGTVDAADYVVWRKGLGTTYTQDDYNIWRANFGATLGGGSSQFAVPLPSSAIPEPTCALLLLSFAATAVWRHRRGLHRPRSRQRNAHSI